MNLHAVIIVLVMVLVFFSGCISSPIVHDSALGELHAHYEYTEGWSVGLGCYERVNGYVYNAGNATVDDVQLNYNLVNTGTGTIQDSRSIYIGSVGQGNTATYETILDGECMGNYRVDSIFMK
jgi:hypothetical protein